MTDLNGLNDAFKNGMTLKLENRGGRSSGITFELKTVFDEMAKKGLIKDTDGKGLTKEEALNMYAKLNEIHNASGKATNFNRMQVGQEFNYTADELLALAEASGYEVINQDEKTELFEAELPNITVAPEEDDEIVIEEKKPVEQEEQPKPQLENVTDDAEMERRNIVNIGERGVEVDTNKTVDGKKNQMTYTVKDENGKTHCYTMVQNEDGTYARGEELVPVYGSNKFITNRELTRLTSTVFPSGVPEGIDVQVLDMNGSPSCIFKKDGKTLTGSDLKALSKSVQTNEVPKEAEPIQPASQPSIDGGVSPRLTPEQVEEFAAKDQRVATEEALLPEYKANYEKLKSEHDAAWASSDFEAIDNAPSNVDVFDAKNKFKDAQRAINKYKAILSNWQDGKKWVLQTGKWAGSEFETTTLPNGQKGYKFEKIENGQKVEYYYNISFEPEFGMATGIPGELVERVVVDDEK